MAQWEWKPKDPQARAKLRYEPGNWGDLLKALWVREALGQLSEWQGEPLRYADPFAGAPDLPWTDAARQRLDLLPELGFLASHSRIPSAARLALEAGAEVAVFDADAERYRAWEKLPVTRLEGSDGYGLLNPEALAVWGKGLPHLVLVDPYDLDKRGLEILPRLADLVEAGCVCLCYLHNRSPRAPGIFQSYGRFRAALTEKLGPVLLGRVPADEFLPRSWHEMMLLGPEGLWELDWSSLSRSTRHLALAILEAGCVEEPDVVGRGLGH